MNQHPQDEFDKYAELCHHRQADGSVQERVTCVRCLYPEPDLPPANDPGQWYSNKDAAALYWRQLLDIALQNTAPEAHIAYIQARLSAAEYVGD